MIEKLGDLTIAEGRAWIRIAAARSSRPDHALDVSPAKINAKYADEMILELRKRLSP